jgi:hypothetical protein
MGSDALNAQQFHQEDLDTARGEMSAAHPVRLGLALNFSDFFYEMLNSSDRVCQLAKQIQPPSRR